jgi:CTP:molybdopterin cytidylyltransferase MocA
VLWEGERLVDRAVRLLRAGGCDPVIVVLGAWEGQVPGAAVVHNPEWADGMGSSLCVGLDAVAEVAAAEPVDRVVITLVDLIGLTEDAVARLTRCDARLAAAAYDGRRGHPVLIGREHFAGVMASAVGDRGAREYLRDREVTLVEVSDVAAPDDLDVPPSRHCGGDEASKAGSPP